MKLVEKSVAGAPGIHDAQPSQDRQVPRNCRPTQRDALKDCPHRLGLANQQFNDPSSG
jgi:hypothetical protein